MGDGTTEDRSVPGPVTSLPRAEADQLVSGGVASNIVFVLARTDMTVKAWGDNVAGQLGLGDTEDRTVPTAVPELADIEDVALAGCTPSPSTPAGRCGHGATTPAGQLGSGTTVAGYQEVKLPGTGHSNIAASLGGNTTYAY